MGVVIDVATTDDHQQTARLAYLPARNPRGESTFLGQHALFVPFQRRARRDDRLERLRP